MRAQGHLVVYRRPSDGVSYELTPSVAQVSACADGTVTTGVITLTAYERVGTERSANLLESRYVVVGDKYYAEYSVDGGAWTEAEQVRLVQGLQIIFAYGIPADKVATVRESLGLRLRHTTDGGTPLLTIAALQVVRDGADGEPGAPGEDAVRHWLTVTPAALTATAEGKYSGSSITAKVMRQVGQQEPESLPLEDVTGAVWGYDMHLKVWYVYRNKLRQQLDNVPDDGVIDLPDGLSAVDLQLYDDATDEIMDTVTVTVTYDGAKGPQGIEGCIHRVSEWAAGFEYHNDEAVTDVQPRYIDDVVITGADGTIVGRWTCRKTHGPSSEANKPVVDGNEWWRPLSDMAPLYTPLIMADNAVIRMTQTNELIVVNDDGQVALHLGKGDWPLWIGAENSDDAPYKVGIDGEFFSTKGNITGKITATSGKIGDWTIYNGMIVSESVGEDGAYMHMDASSPMIAMGRVNGEMSYVSPDGILANWAGVDAVPTLDAMHLGSIVGMGRGNLETFASMDPLTNIVTGVYGVAENTVESSKLAAESYGGYFEGLMASGLSLRPLAVGDGETVYMGNSDTMVVGLAGTSAATVYLPASPRYGQVHFLKQWAGDSMFIKPQGKHKIRQNQNVISQYQISGGHWAMVTFFRTVDRTESIDGVWLVTGV